MERLRRVSVVRGAGPRVINASVGGVARGVEVGMRPSRLGLGRVSVAHGQV